MKKRIIIFSLVFATLSLAAFGFINRNHFKTNQDVALNSNVVKINRPLTENETKDPIEFFYFVSPRFDAISKQTIDNATSVHDFLSEKNLDEIDSVYSSELILIVNDKRSDIREYGNGDALSENQIKLLRSVDHSKHFLIRANYKKDGASSNDTEDYHFSPHYTVVPEKQATYADGLDSLLKYLKDNKSKDTEIIDTKKLQAVKASFTINKDGSLTDIELDRTTNYPALDLELTELIKNIPGEWEPAKNTNGEKVDQVLVLSFGLEGSC